MFIEKLLYTFLNEFVRKHFFEFERKGKTKLSQTVA